MKRLVLHRLDLRILQSSVRGKNVQTLRILSGGFIVTSLLWASAVVALIDQRLRLAAGYFAVAAACSFVGIIHSPLPGSPLVNPLQLPDNLPHNALGQTPLDHLLQAVGAEADPASGGRQMPAHYGDVRYNIANTSSPTGAVAIAARIASVGRETVSERRSITGSKVVQCACTSRTARRAAPPPHRPIRSRAPLP